MKNLSEKLENGLIPIVEIAKMIYRNHADLMYESNFVDFNTPEFDDEGRLLVDFCGDRNGTGITDWLYFENNQFKILSCDCGWTSDSYLRRKHVVEANQIPLIKKLIELGAITAEEVGW